MAEWISGHKKQCIIALGIIAVILAVLYFRALFLPGLWHGDTFLYKQADGSFTGSDFYGDYKMVIKEAEFGTDIEFSVNDKTNNYQVLFEEYDFERKVEVLENGNTICKGKAMDLGGYYVVFDDETGSSDVISIRVEDEIPDEEELFPTCSRLYTWSVSDKTDIRGNLYMVFLILIFGIILFVDIKYPNLFWFFRHGIDVDGGEPSDWYRFGQIIERVILSLGILICAILTFTTH